MKKVLLAGTVALALMAVGCTKSSNVNGPSNSTTTTITDDITTTKSYSGTIHITSDITISGNVTFAKKASVIVDPGVQVIVNGGGSLTIAEGVSIKLGAGAYFDIGESTSGALIANGTDSLPISFNTSTTGSKWGYGSSNTHSGGIWIDDYATTTTSLTYCKIHNATSGIFIADGKTVPVANCTIDSCQYDGVCCYYTGTPKDSANIFTANDNYGIVIASSQLSNLSTTTSVAGNTKGGVDVYGDNVTTSGTWKALDAPYIVDGTISINNSSTITIAPGATFTFNALAYIDVGESSSGALIANGTITNPIVFNTSTVGSIWGYGSSNTHSGGIWIDGYATTTTSLQYCKIYNATSGIFIANAKTATVANCTIDSCQYDGLCCSYTGTPKDSANIFKANGFYGIVISSSQLSNISATTSVAGNTKGGVYVYADEVTTSGTWKALDAPYIVDGTISINNSSTITIAPGATFTFNAVSYIDIGESSSGTLIANGTAVSPITFTNSTAGANWGYDGNTTNSGGLYFDSHMTTLCSISYCTISNATTGILTKKAITIDHCNIINNQYYGIDYYSTGLDANVNLYTSTLTGNGMGATN